MSARGLSLPLLPLALALLLAIACGGGDGGAPAVGRLTDSDTVPTATPRTDQPDPIILDPGALTPDSDGGADDTGPDDEVGDEVSAVTPFQVTTDESANRRASPSTDSGIAGTIAAGAEVTVTGQVRGEAVAEGNDIWYQLDDDSFVYSGAVTKVE